MLHPYLHIKVFNRRIKSFHFYGVLGYVTGLLLGLMLTYLLGLELSITLLMGLTAAATFFLLAVLAKVITGRETIVYYHHEIAILLICSIVLTLIGRPVLPYLEITLVGIGTFLAFGRIGCYSVGCCHGRPGKHGVKYGQSHVEDGFTWYYKDIPLMPVQLVESAYVFAIVFLNVFLLLSNVAPGTVLLVYTVIYGLMRYVIEFFRGDPERPLWFGLSEAQWTTLGLIAITSGLSLAGMLPLYQWHLVIFALVAITSLLVAFYFRKQRRFILFTPPHVRQLAEGLNMLSDFDSLMPAAGKPKNIYSTKEGLCLSCGMHSDGQAAVRHYTISSANAALLNTELATRIACQIGLLRKHGGEFEIIDKQNGIYHILFPLNGQAPELSK